MAKRIMVIDNDEAMQSLFEVILRDEGWEIYAYDYARADLGVVRQLMPDLIILDLHEVQVGAGWSFLQLLKMEDVTAVIPVVICTTDLMLPLEIDGYLTTRQISVVRMPFDVEALIVTIKNNLTPSLVFPILVVEDNEELSESVTTILGLWGYPTMTALNGRVALDAVTQTRHALILLDISMPVMTGLEFIVAYAEQLGPHSPIVIFTAEPESVPEDLPEFVIDILPKPFELSQLVTLVTKYAEPVWGEVGQ